MKIFISSLISGMESQRAAVKRAVLALGHEPIMAEAFGAKATSPQIACLQGLRQADLVILILGERYGAVQPSGLSATHEEFREAKDRKPMLTFVRVDIAADPQQQALIAEVGAWEGGFLRAPFVTPDSLGDAVSGAIHQWELAHAVAPLNPEEMRSRALAMLPVSTHGSQTSGVSFLLAIAPGPLQSVLRPAELETPALAEAIQQEGLFGTHRIFDKAFGFETSIRDGALRIHQEGRHGRTRALVVLRENGDTVVQLAIDAPSERIGFPAIIEEELEHSVRMAMGFAAWLLDRIDSTHRLTHAVLAVRLSGGSYWGWRTRAEQAANPGSGSIPVMGHEEQRDQPITLTPAHRARSALSMDAARLTEDFIVLLRRRWKGR